MPIEEVLQIRTRELLERVPSDGDDDHPEHDDPRYPDIVPVVHESQLILVHTVAAPPAPSTAGKPLGLVGVTGRTYSVGPRLGDFAKGTPLRFVTPAQVTETPA
jgi:hypothetical protein